MRNFCSGCRGDTHELAVALPTRPGKDTDYYCVKCLARRYPDDNSAKGVVTFKAWKNGLLPWALVE